MSKETLYHQFESSKQRTKRIKGQTASDNKGFIFLSELVDLVEEKTRGITGKSLQLSIRNAAKTMNTYALSIICRDHSDIMYGFFGQVD